VPECVVAVREVEGDHTVAGTSQVFEVLQCLVREFVVLAVLGHGGSSIMSRHLLSRGFGAKNILETHVLRYPGSQKLDCRNLGSSESMKSSCCCVRSSMEVPLLKGGGRRPPMKGIRTP
jgi:hypothetical protein